MTFVPKKDGQQTLSPTRRARRIRVSTISLLATGALCTTLPTPAATITNLAEFITALNDPGDENIVITGGDLDLMGQTFTLVVAQTQFFGDGTPRTISNGTIIVTSASEANYNLLNLSVDSIFTGDIILNEFARMDIDESTNLGVGATVTAAENTDIRLFSFTGDTNTYDATFFAKFSGVADSTSFSVVGNGDGIFTALPTFGAELVLDTYREFEFATAPLTDPTLTLAANLSGNHAVTINVGTLDLDDFDFTIDSLAGDEDTEITLGSGTLTTGDSTSTTYAGVISGTGDLTKTGTGAFTLSGVNTYTGTTTVTEGTLRFLADQTGHTALVVEDGGILLINATQTSDPAYTIEDGGIANLNADIADTTPFTIDTGGLLNFNLRPQTIASIAGGGTIDINNTTMTVGDANDTTFSGNIIGALGSVTKVGTGNLTLSGNNTYTGTTTISAGTITLDGSLQDASTVSIATGATLDLNDNDETLGTITGAGDITLGSATLTVGNASNFTFGGVISETGGLTKNGTGTFTLSGDQTYTGATAINAGTLIALGDLATSGVTVASGATFNLESIMTDANADVTVNSGGTLFGTGTIGDNLINNGTITFVGSGLGDTLTVNGDYTQGGTGTLNIQIGNAGGLAVAGAANLDGTLNIATPADPATFDINATYDVLTASSISGNFATVTDEFVFLDLTTNNVGGNVQVSLARNGTALNSITQTVNQTNIANILDSVTPTGELDSALDRILASSESGALATLDQLAGAAAATASTQAAANAIGQSHRLLDQLVGVRPGTTRPLGAFGPTAGPIEFDDTDHITLLSFAQDSPEEVGDDTELDFTPWASIYGGFGDQGDGPEGLDYTRYGLIAGLDLTAEESLARYGFSLGIEQTEFDLNSSTGEIDIQSIYLAGYARQPLGNDFFFSVLGSLGYHSHESERNILIGTIPTRAQADFDSFSVSFAGEISKAFNFERIPVDPGGHPTVTTLEPFARLDYSISSQDGYNESGAGTAGLNVSSEDFDSSRVSGGLRVEHQYMIFNQSEATLRGNALVSFALTNTDSTLSASFVNTPGSNFEIVGADQDDIFGQIGVGLSVEINDNWDFHFDVDQMFSDESTGTVIAGMLSYEF